MRNAWISRAGWAAALAACALAVLPVASAGAQPVLKITNVTGPTFVRPGDNATFTVIIRNVGSSPTSGPLTMTDAFPAGMTPTGSDPGISGYDLDANGTEGFGLRWFCEGAPTLTCFTPDALQPGAYTPIKITAGVEAGAAGGLTDAVSLSGGGAAPVTFQRPIQAGSTLPSYELLGWSAALTNPDGSPSRQAGGHPWAITTSFRVTTVSEPEDTFFGAAVQEQLKDVHVELPPGFVGDPSAIPTCRPEQLAQRGLVEGQIAGLCPPASQVGVVRILSEGQFLVPIYNVEPPPGVPAAFGFNVEGVVVMLTASLRNASDYGVTVNSPDTSTTIPLQSVDVTFWGVPADPSHNGERVGCIELQSTPTGALCAPAVERKAFLRAPTSCAGALGLPIRLNTWEHPDVFHEADTSLVGMTGCELVPFEPSLAVQPTEHATDSPTGLDVTVGLPQNHNPDGLGESDLRRVVATLPAGMTINPSVAGGLAACGDGELKLGSSEPASCPDSSRIGTVTVYTPLLEEPVQGSVFIRSQGSNDPASGEMYRAAIELRDDERGVDVKTLGEIKADPVTGQLTAVFDNIPQLPFSELQLHLKSGPRAPLVTPSGCGAQTVGAQMTGWSGALRTPPAGFSIDCSGSEGFSPLFTAGTVNNQAGAFSPFVLSFSREDNEQLFAGIQQTLAPGLLAKLAGVQLCSNTDAAAGTCPAASQIGTVTAGAGVGPDPYFLQGKIYLTGAYNGGAFGETVVVPAKAGPFDLGNVVVRGAIRIDPKTAQATVISDPFPQVVAGVPAHLRKVVVTLDRPGFTFNPTNCEPLSIPGTLTSAQGTTVNVSSHFQAANCANLAFKPSFTVSTAGKTSKANGASLHVHLATHGGPSSAGAPGESNIAKVDVQLPIVLPARLPTLQKACTAAQFGADPAGCPVGSFVGTAIAHTPILASPLSGPAILVSHGGEAFPDLVLVLQGEGVRINLTGHTQIKKGITFNHFETVPDAPVSSFDLTLPAGPHGVLTTDIPGRNLCATTRTVTVTKRITRRVNGHTRRVTVKAKKAVAAPLLMPTTMTAQNGAVIHQNTKIAVTGCATVKTKAKKRRRGRPPGGSARQGRPG